MRGGKEHKAGWPSSTYQAPHVRTQTQPSVEPHGVGQRANDVDTFSDVFLQDQLSCNPTRMFHRRENTTQKA